jgi:Bacterial regulatory proteins, luxR family
MSLMRRARPDLISRTSPAAPPWSVPRYLAEKTVKNHVSNLLAKLGMDRRTEAAVFAVRTAAQRDPSHLSTGSAADPISY